MKNLKLTALLLTLSMVLSTAACGARENVSTQDVQTNITVSTEQKAEESAELPQTTIDEVKEEVSNQVSYPVTIVDQAQREIIIEKEPETLVSGYYISSSLLIALELDDKMVGIEAKAGKRPIYKLAAKELIDLPSVGSAKEFDLEGCAALQPDLVILPLKLKNSAESLEELGIKTILVNPESEALLMEMVDIISTATNTVNRANELKSFISSTKSTLTEKVSATEVKDVYLAGNSNVLSTAGNKMYQSDMITLAGGKNVASDIDEKYWVDVDYEQILVWDPEYIIIAAEAEYTVEDVLNDVNLAACKAVVNQNVYKFPSDAEAWDSPVPSGVLGSVWLAGILHSDVVSSEESNAIIEEFYEKFYEFKYGEK